VLIEAVKAIQVADPRPSNVGEFLADKVLEAARPPPSGGFARNPLVFGKASSWVPLDYVEAKAMPLINQALSAANAKRPEDPIDFLASFLRKAGTGGTL
jgi:hypothetical protein